MEEIYTPEQVAKKLSVTKTTVLRWLRSGELKGVRLGHKTWRIREEQLDAFLKGRSLESGDESWPS